MILEIVAAVALGLLLMWMAFGAPGSRESEIDVTDLDPVEETPRGRALIAIKELEFDRETGKIADDDYRDLKERLSLEAMKVLEADAAPVGAERPAAVPALSAAPRSLQCPRCGPRPERDARYCSNCGGAVPLTA